MYRGFDLHINNNFFSNDDDIFSYFFTYHDHGLEFYRNYKKKVHSNFDEIIDEISEKKIINGDLLQNRWFPTELFKDDNFVFISHSHKDEELAISLAGYLDKELHIKSFIDSCVWGYMDKLNKKLNNCSLSYYNHCTHCNCDDFSHNISYVHMMLASALMTMIDKCECMFFLNTPSSINLNNKTESAWIYYELNIANIIQKTSRIERSTTESTFGFTPKIEFTPNLENMPIIDEDDLKDWKKKYLESNQNAFEILYEIYGGLKDD